jgi:hypothetical protein
MDETIQKKLVTMGISKDCSKLNMDFFKFYTAGVSIRVDIPCVGERQGKVGVTQCKTPVFVLLGKGNSYWMLLDGCKYIGPAIRKTRIDSPGYLGRTKPLYQVQE